MAGARVLRRRPRAQVPAALTPYTRVRSAVRRGAEAGWLVIEKRRQFGAGKTPFQVRVPLAALTESRVAKPIGLVGSSIALALTTGDELVFDIMAGLDAATTVARRFGDAAPPSP
jgi:hypothetical protein